jgi:hypothetical protein
MLGPRSTVIEEAATGDALTFVCTLHDPVGYVGAWECPIGSVRASLARLRTFDEADLEGGAVNRVAKSDYSGSSSRGSSP